MTLYLTETAHHSPQQWAGNVAGRRGLVDTLHFPYFWLICRETEAERHGHYIERHGPRRPHSQPPTWTRINKPPLVAGTVKQTYSEPGSRTSRTSRTPTRNRHLQACSLAHPGATRQKGPAVALPGWARNNAL